MIGHRRLVSMPWAAISLTACFAANIQSTALAQITVGLPSTNFVFTDDPMIQYTHNEQATDFSAGNTVDLLLTGDWIAGMPRMPLNAIANIEGYLPFTVGNLPVEITNLRVMTNAKWVNGGGTSEDPIFDPMTFWSFDGELREQLGALPDAGTDPLVNRVTDQDSFSGNGFSVVNFDSQTVGTPGPYVLGSLRTYYVHIETDTTIQYDNTIANSPSVTVTHEFGGTFGDPFNGYEVSFDWVTVPEPSTLALAGCGALGLVAVALRRRRRSKAPPATA